jgi:NTP pyrophosphatase (non-canonical NTP hydrolase)
MLNEIAKEIHANNVSKGFYDKPVDFGTRIALMHSELSEALEAHREGKVCHGDIKLINSFVIDEMFETDYKIGIKGTIEEEMADIIIRALDYCAFKGIDIDEHVKAKMRYNSMRPHMHGGKKY